MANQWSFAGYTFPYADSPARGKGGEWNLEEKLIEQDPLMASVTLLTSWGQRSARRVISGTCGQTTRDTLRAAHQNATVSVLEDSEGREMTCRIVRADFDTLLPIDRYDYVVEFIVR